MTRTTRVVSLSVTLALAGCTAEAETAEVQTVQTPPQDANRDESVIPVDQVAPQASPGAALAGGPASAGVTRGSVSRNCDDWFCGQNHNRRLVRI